MPFILNMQYPANEKLLKIKREQLHAAPFYEFPIGTISKVKKIVLGLRYKGHSFLRGDKNKKHV